MFDDVEIIIPDIGEVPRQKPCVMEPGDWRDGLLIRSPNWLGDIAMTFPAMLQLKLLLPETCGLFVVCPKGLAPLFHALDIVDCVLPLEDAHAFPTRKEWEAIRRLHCGAAVLFNNSLRDAISLKSASIPKLFGAAARGRSFLLKEASHFPKRRDFVLNSPHHAAKYLSIAYQLGAPEWKGRMPEMNPVIEPELLSDGVSAILEHGRLMVLAPGAAYGDAKRWPADRFRAVASDWIQKGGIVVSAGSKAERSVAEETLAGLPGDKAFNLAGMTTLEELMLLLKRSSIVVANDSGVMHLAAALGAKGVAVFGSTDCVATSPVSKDWRILYKKLPCGPCFKRDCPKGTKECYEPVTPEMVLEAIRSLSV